MLEMGVSARAAVDDRINQCQSDSATEIAHQIEKAASIEHLFTSQPT